MIGWYVDVEVTRCPLLFVEKELKSDGAGYQRAVSPKKLIESCHVREKWGDAGVVTLAQNGRGYGEERPGRAPPRENGEGVGLSDDGDDDVSGYSCEERV